MIFKKCSKRFRKKAQKNHKIYAVVYNSCRFFCEKTEIRKKRLIKRDDCDIMKDTKKRKSCILYGLILRKGWKFASLKKENGKFNKAFTFSRKFPLYFVRIRRNIGKYWINPIFLDFSAVWVMLGCAFQCGKTMFRVNNCCQWQHYYKYSKIYFLFL